MLKSMTAALIASTLVVPLAAIAETQSLTCTVGGKPMTLTYEGDDMTGTLIAKTPWGDMNFTGVTYGGGDPYGTFAFRSQGDQPAVVMPDLDKLMKCIKGHAKSAEELMDLDLLQINTEACVPKTPNGKAPVPALVEINAGVLYDYENKLEIDVDVYRTYAAESPVADGHIVIVLPQDQKPVCQVTTPQ